MNTQTPEDIKRALLGIQNKIKTLSERCTPRPLLFKTASRYLQHGGIAHDISYTFKLQDTNFSVLMNRERCTHFCLKCYWLLYLNIDRSKHINILAKKKREEMKPYSLGYYFFLHYTFCTVQLWNLGWIYLNFIIRNILRHTL